MACYDANWEAPHDTESNLKTGSGIQMRGRDTVLLDDCEGGKLGKKRDVRELEYNRWLVTWIASFLTDRSTVISFDAFKSEVYRTTTGIPQGSPLSPLSPILYLYYNADLIEACNQEPNTIATGYIDNVAILRWGTSIEETCNGLETTI